MKTSRGDRRVRTHSFVGYRFPPEVTLFAGRWLLRYGLSYRDVEELLAERGVEVDDVTIHRWVQRFTPLLIDAARPCRHGVGDWWFVDETYVAWQRNTAATQRFFESVLGARGRAEEATTDLATPLLRVVDDVLSDVVHDTAQYTNNRVETDHGRLKPRPRPTLVLKRDRTASAIIRVHAFIQNLRRGHYELGNNALTRPLRLAAAFDELAETI